MNEAWRVKATTLVVSAALLAESAGLAGQSASQRRQTVQAGPATLQVTIKGRGEPIVFIPSRGRGVEDFDDLSTRLVQTGYQAILPEPRGIGGSTGPLAGITYHDLASDVAAVIQSVASRPVTVIGHAFGTRVARTLAADHPQRVKQLILLAAAGAVPRSADTEATTTRFWETLSLRRIASQLSVRCSSRPATTPASGQKGGTSTSRGRNEPATTGRP